MYTATVQNVAVDKERKNFCVTVKFTDGVNNHTNNFFFPFGSKKNRVFLEIKRYLSELETTETDVAEVSLGAIDLTTIADPILPQTEIDRNTWIADYRKLSAAQKLIDLGALTGSETAIVNLRNKVKNNFSVAYIDFIV